jgi:hypothetical protein
VSNPVISIAFAYTADTLVLAALKEFHVYAVDPNNHARLSPALVVPKTAIPTLTAPLSVTMTAYGAQCIEVVPCDLQGNEGHTTYAPVFVALPSVQSVAQVTT